MFFCDGSRRYWPHYIERVEQQIEVVEAWGYKRLMPPIAVGPLETGSIVTMCGSREATEEIVMTSLACAADD